MVDKRKVEITDEPEKRRKNLRKLLRVLKLPHRARRLQLDLLGQIHDKVQLGEALLVDCAHAVVDQLTAEEHAQGHDSQVVVFALIKGVQSLRVNDDCCCLVTLGRLAVRDRPRINPKTLHRDVRSRQWLGLHSEEA